MLSTYSNFNPLHLFVCLFIHFLSFQADTPAAAPAPLPKPRQPSSSTPTTGAPVPLRRKHFPPSGSNVTGCPPVATRSSDGTGQHQALRARMSAELPPLPPKSPDSESTSPPTVPRRQGLGEYVFTGLSSWRGGSYGKRGYWQCKLFFFCLGWGKG